MTPEVRKTPGHRRSISLALIQHSGAKAEPWIVLRTEAGQGTPLDRSTSAAQIPRGPKNDLWRPAQRLKHFSYRISCAVCEVLRQTPDSTRHTRQRFDGELRQNRKEATMPREM